MAGIFRHLRNTLAELAAYAGIEGEFRWISDTKTIAGFDGSTAGGFPMMREDRNNDASGIGHKTGRYYGPFCASPANGNLTLNAGELIGILIRVDKTVAITKIGCRVQTAQASAKIRLGLYRVVDGYPASLVAGSDGGEIDASSTGDKELTIAVTLKPGWYVLAANTGTASVAIATATGPNGAVWKWAFGHADTTTTPGLNSWTVAQAYGAMPASFPAGWADSASWPYFWLRK